jgi:hypothetical protein
MLEWLLGLVRCARTEGASVRVVLGTIGRGELGRCWLVRWWWVARLGEER